MSIGFLYASLAMAGVLFALVALIKIDAAYRRWKIRRRRRARGGDITEELARRVRFYDDQPETRELLG